MLAWTGKVLWIGFWQCTAFHESVSFSTNILRVYLRR